MSDDLIAIFERDPLLLLQSLMLVCGTVIAVGTVAAVQYRKFRQTQEETSLKFEMLERGLSAEEIVQVVSAGRQRQRPGRERDPARAFRRGHYGSRKSWS